MENLVSFRLLSSNLLMILILQTQVWAKEPMQSRFRVNQFYNQQIGRSSKIVYTISYKRQRRLTVPLQFRFQPSRLSNHLTKDFEKNMMTCHPLWQSPSKRKSLWMSTQMKTWERRKRRRADMKSFPLHLQTAEIFMTSQCLATIRR